MSLELSWLSPISGWISQLQRWKMSKRKGKIPALCIPTAQQESSKQDLPCFPVSQSEEFLTQAVWATNQPYLLASARMACAQCSGDSWLLPCFQLKRHSSQTVWHTHAGNFLQWTLVKALWSGSHQASYSQKNWTKAEIFKICYSDLPKWQFLLFI